MWDLPGPGVEPLSSALAGRFLTTVPPGVSILLFLKLFKVSPLLPGWSLNSSAGCKGLHLLLLYLLPGLAKKHSSYLHTASQLCHPQLSPLPWMLPSSSRSDEFLPIFQDSNQTLPRLWQSPQFPAAVIETIIPSSVSLSFLEQHCSIFCLHKVHFC